MHAVDVIHIGMIVSLDTVHRPRQMSVAVE